jgi:hypothetical protein
MSLVFRKHFPFGEELLNRLEALLFITLKLLDELYPQFFAGRTVPKGYFWKVVHDPTRNGEDPGLFYGSHFRLLDILPTWDETSPWPEGIIFEHTQTGQRLTFIDNQPVYLNHPQVSRRRRSSKKEEEFSPEFSTPCPRSDDLHLRERSR